MAKLSASSDMNKRTGQIKTQECIFYRLFYTNTLSVNTKLNRILISISKKPFLYGTPKPCGMTYLPSLSAAPPSVRVLIKIPGTPKPCGMTYLPSLSAAPPSVRVLIKIPSFSNPASAPTPIPIMLNPRPSGPGKRKENMV